MNKVNTKCDLRLLQTKQKSMRVRLLVRLLRCVCVCVCRCVCVCMCVVWCGVVWCVCGVCERC